VTLWKDIASLPLRHAAANEMHALT
jgi:hypothetical protein